MEQALRRIFYHIIVENKQHGLGEETVFDFKYIPNLSLIGTEAGKYEASHRKRGIESRNLRTLVIASVVVAAAACLLMRTTWSFLGLVKRGLAV